MSRASQKASVRTQKVAAPLLESSKAPGLQKGLGWKIEREDFARFLTSLTAGSVDLVLTDPPYTISRETGFKKVGRNSVERFAVSMDFGRWDHAQIDLNKLAKCMLRALRTGGTAIVWYDVWKITELAQALEKAGFKMLRLFIWEKTNPVPLNARSTYLSNSREIAICAVKGGKPTFNSYYNSGVLKEPIPRHNGHRVHPTQKPLDLFSKLIKVHSNKGDLVVDPFLGGGTTAVAALQQGRKFQGCDINLKYVRASKKRVATEI